MGRVRLGLRLGVRIGSLLRKSAAFVTAPFACVLCCVVLCCAVLCDAVLRGTRCCTDACAVPCCAVLHYDGLMLCGAAVSCTSPTLSRLQPSSESQSIHGLRSPSALGLVFEIDATVMSSPCFCSAALHDSSCGGEQWGARE